MTGKPGGPQPAARDLLQAAQGTSESWKSVIQGGSPEQPVREGKAGRHQADAPAKPVAPKADLSGVGETFIKPEKQ